MTTDAQWTHFVRVWRCLTNQVFRRPQALVVELFDEAVEAAAWEARDPITGEWPQPDDREWPREYLGQWVDDPDERVGGRSSRRYVRR